jgi:hypothetical protein
MKLHEALNETGIAEATCNGLVYVVRSEQADFSPSEPDGEPNDPNDYVLTIAVGAMPPHVTRSYARLEDLEKEYDFTWTSVEPEE